MKEITTFEVESKTMGARSKRFYFYCGGKI